MKKWKTIFISAGLLSSVALFPSLIACNDTNDKSGKQGNGQNLKKSEDSTNNTETQKNESEKGKKDTERDKDKKEGETESKTNENKNPNQTSDNDSKNSEFEQKWSNAFEFVDEDDYGKHFKNIWDQVTERNKESKQLQRYTKDHYYFSFKGVGRAKNTSKKNKYYLFKLKDTLDSQGSLIQFTIVNNEKFKKEQQFLNYEYDLSSKKLTIKYIVKDGANSKEFSQVFDIPDPKTQGSKEKNNDTKQPSTPETSNESKEKNITPPATKTPNDKDDAKNKNQENEKLGSDNSQNKPDNTSETNDKKTEKGETAKTDKPSIDKKDENQSGSSDASKEEKWKNAFELYDSGVTFEKIKSKYEGVKKKSKKFKNENYIQKYGKNDNTFFGIKSGGNKQDNKLFKLHNGLNSNEIEFNVFKTKSYTQEYFDFSIDETNKKVTFKFKVKGIEKEITQEISFPTSSESSTNSKNQSGSSNDEDE
ncbi:hypothetical protein RRG44_03300 [Mycoplasmopsis cynos]|uniref:hypothetical protein n=1 Tax=Mycoplasmopsis cynos TaxID=171284 RepID=UPI002AFE3A18|nr:hypothetical protein [Mycoplasmopsis cynos]WQQ19116.1 hypothetical protein RRG44_03300 [Mycoplasmopsis cynos]